MATRLYTYHMKAGKTSPGEALALREGFAWGGFLFGALWAVYYRLWLAALALAAGHLVIQAAVGEGWLPLEVGATALLLLNVYAGCSGNDWRREKYERSGWVMVGLASGRDQTEADRRFLDAVFQRRPAPQMVLGS
ncbi:MAG: DUF2628 domain-containing protein [Alphaproteobacteria bacterium]|jgi:hypothetical protein|nr:DUF2628 domain-containing protein [Alphaproteobacteria bacterium]MDP6239108.1 DUF2628 domain-containing protein [Alphaproteobacteria bacterium]MDP7173417.1 DUF2628 domain-containing protein [Alphaproteobacteria bacterium]MDP7232645.1 DUF2628 domain-containing protein [Alphaproteobacteria bacterium]MDP7486944.1 DUF2628 domain-containing protein [Alphaproteobacteria bacterium]